MTIDDLKELRDYHLREAVRCGEGTAQRGVRLWHQRKAEGLAELVETLEIHLPALNRALGANPV